jgi:NADH:ubiquinone oxidoreductase subunit 2 (subunit N)
MAASGLLLGLALFSKYFAGLLAIAYAVYLLPRRGGLPKLLVVALCALPFMLVNLAWNSTHCWNNILFNLMNRNASSQFSFGHVTVYAAMLVYLAIYVPMTIGGFVAVLMLRDAEGRQLEAISDLAGLSGTRPLLALGLGSVMFSMAGIPFFFGFWGKFVVFQAAVAAGLLPLAVIAAAGSVIGAFYYLKIVKVMYFDEPAAKVTGRSDLVQEWLLAICALLISPLGWLLTKGLGALAAVAAGVLFVAA